MHNIPVIDVVAPGPHHSGFSLLEVLIALVIMSVGLLGIAAMIGTSLKTNDSAYMRSQATALAYNIVDRMRANLSTAQTAGSPYSLTMPYVPPPSASTVCNGAGAGCSGTALADFDMSQWEYDLSQMLPQGLGAVTITPNAFTGGTSVNVLVTVRWNDSRAYNGLQRTGAPPVTTYQYVTVSSQL